MKLILTYFDSKVSKMLVQKQNEKGEKFITVSSAMNFVSRGEILVRVIEVDDESDSQKYIDQGYSYYKTMKFNKLSIDSSVYYDEVDRCYKARFYGFATINTNYFLKVTSPLQTVKEKTLAYFFIHPTKFKKIPTMADIHEELSLEKIVTPVDSQIIEASLKKIDVTQARLSKIVVAKSKAPIHGRSEYYESLIDLEKKAGKVEMDGHIDFKEVNSIHEVKKGEPVLKRYPKIIPEPGFTIFGDKASARVDPPKGLLQGENVVQSTTDPNLYVAAVDGCIFMNNRKLSVKEVAIIAGDIDYESGNIDFNGSVQISGNVLPGFSVKAGGDITIEGSVDDARIIAGGSVKVSLGIAGKGKSFIQAGRDLSAKYLLNTTVEVAGVVTIDESIINCKVFSNTRIIVTAEHGKIMGGAITARYTIEVNSIGSKKETSTELMVGRIPAVEKILDAQRRELIEAKEVVSEQMNLLKNRFGNNLFEDPKGFISVLPDVKKKTCVVMLNELTIRKKLESDIKEKISETERLLVLTEEPLILIRGKLYSGTHITIRREVKKIEEEMTNARFFYDKDEKLIRFSSCT